VKIYSDQDDGTSVSLTPGDSFQVRLTENPTTGYRWHLVDWDRSILDLTLDKFQTPGTSRHGAGGEHLWEFVARAPGQSLLQWAYRRRWESAASTRNFSLRVSVT
jgi:inhibitor of cysteine peptidase